MKTRIISILIILLFLTLLSGQLCFQVSATKQFDNEPTDMIERFFVSYELGTQRPSVVDYDATNEYVFFAYSENIAVVDAYNMSGEFAFSILFTFREKGSISVRCENNLLYVSTKLGNVFIFDHDQLIDVIESSSVTEKGYGWKWFEGKKRNVSLIGINMYKLNQEGSKSGTIPIPFNVIWGIYSSYSLVVAIIFALSIMVFRPKHQSKQHTMLPRK